MRNDFIEHSAKGTSWSKKDHKYSAKKVSKSGKTVYLYGPTDLADSVVGIKNKDFLEDFSNSLNDVEPIRKAREKSDSLVIWSPNKNQETLVSKGQKAIAKIFDKEKKNKQVVKKR